MKTTDTVSFANDIRPLFRPIDIEHMLPFAVLLDDYAYMSNAANDHKNARDVHDFLSGSQRRRCRSAAHSGRRTNWRCTSAG